MRTGQIGRVTDGLCLAPTPVFAAMAILTAFGGAGSEMLCSAAHGSLPLNGMVTMYALMSVFHAAPWLKLVSVRRTGAPGQTNIGRERNAALR